MYQTHPMTVGTGRHSGPITLHKTTLSQQSLLDENLDTHLKPTYNQLTLEAVAAKRDQRKKARPVSGTIIRSRPRTSTTGILGGVHGIKVGTNYASIKPRRDNKSVNYARASQS